MRITPIHKILYQIPTPFGGAGTVFLYLLKGERVALIDTGAADSPRGVLEPALAEIGLALSDVDLILNTHAHLDHSGGNMEMKQASGARIHVHSADLPMARSTETQVEFHIAPLRHLDFPPEAVRERADYVVHNAGESVEPDVALADGDRIDLGGGVVLRVVHCPGHTPGHVAFLWEEEGVLLAGDGIQGQGSRLGGYPYYFNAPDYRRSLDKLAELDPRMLCLGHAFVGGPAVCGPVRVGDDGRALLKESMRVADALYGAVAEALRRLPGASRRQVALAALDELIYEIPQLRLRSTGMPAAAGPALLASLEAALKGGYPE